jgi:FkbM family methyltransferase
MKGLASDRFITPCLDVYGEYSRQEWLLLDQLIKPGMTIVEAGSNIGVHTVPMARKCAPGILYAFEPQREVLTLLIENLRMNAISNVKVLPSATGSEVGVAIVPLLDYAEANNFGGVSLRSEGEGYEVRVQPIDDLQLAHCGLIKIDVEGAELPTLRGAMDTIARCRPVVYIENDRQEHQQAIISALSEVDYELYWHAPPIVDAQNFNDVQENVFGQRFISINMICLPAERQIIVQDHERIDPRNWRSPKGR